MGKIHQANLNKRKARAVILIYDKTELRLLALNGAKKIRVRLSLQHHNTPALSQSRNYRKCKKK